MTAMLPEENAQSENVNVMQAEVTAHKSLDITSLTALRDGAEVDTELDTFSDWGKRILAKMSAIGSLRAKDRRKEGRVFNSENTDKLNGHADTLFAISKEIKDMLAAGAPIVEDVVIAPPEKTIDFSLLFIQSQSLDHN